MDTLNWEVRPGGRHEQTEAAQPVRRKTMLYRTARRVVGWLRQLKTFVAGFLIGLSVWTPIFFATAAEETEWQSYGLPTGLVMLGAGIWLRIGGPSLRRHGMQPRDPAGPPHTGMDRLTA